MGSEELKGQESPGLDFLPSWSKCLGDVFVFAFVISIGFLFQDGV